MTRPPQGPPPGAGGAYPPDPGYRDAGPPPGYVDPNFVPPPYPPGREPIEPRRPRRRSPVMAPILALVGLLLVAGASLWAMSFLNATLDDAAASEPTPAAVVAAVDPSDDPGTEPGASDDPGSIGVPVPSDPPDDVIVGATAPPIMVVPPSDERADVKGSILFTRSGDIWSASGTELQRLTNSDAVRSDGDPVWSANGKHIYFIRSSKKVTSNARPGGKYTLYPTDLVRMDADGGNKKTIFDSLIKTGGLWFSTVAQPAVSPGGNTVAVVSDGNNGSADEVTLHVVNTKTGRLRKVATATEPRLGHNDPVFNSEGTKIAFTYNDNAGTESNPRIAIHTCQTKANCSIGKTRYLKYGFANPSWSPDGKLLAVESTDGHGRDIAIITARRGDVRVKLTNDGNSFAPVFSPNGDQIAYLHRDGLDIDLRVMTLDIDRSGKITLVDDRPVTSDGGIDGSSTPSWHIPRGQLTDTSATPQPEASSPAEDGATSEEPTAAADAVTDGVPPPPPGS